MFLQYKCNTSAIQVALLQVMLWFLETMTEKMPKLCVILYCPGNHMDMLIDQ